MDRIKTFPSDIIKIDKSFVETIDNADDPNPLIESLIQLSQSYGKMIIVEGVETKEQLIKVKNLGCNHAQGFLFEKPTPIESIIKRFKH
jgi:EAL domain-containing protein (putative c-di-GMP-specific phosphodiesterase class I)